MPLTPANVHNVTFSEPPIGKRGYSKGGVDQFPDLVKGALGGLRGEDAELCQYAEDLEGQLEQGDGADCAASGVAVAVPAINEDRLRKEVEQKLRAECNGHLSAQQQGIEVHYQGCLDVPGKRASEAEASAQQASSASAERPQAIAASTGAESQEVSPRIARILWAVQDTASRVTIDANARADKLVTEARENADRTVAKVNEETERTVADTHNEVSVALADTKECSKRLLADTCNEFESTLTDARQRDKRVINDADARPSAIITVMQQKTTVLQEDAGCKRHKIMTTIEEQQTALEGRIGGLYIFEREYRTRLKTSLESQLDDLNSRESAAPADGYNN